MSKDILEFLQHHNRPYSLTEILQSIGKSKDLGKAAIQKALDKLVDNGQIFDKIYGKSKIYCIKQPEDATDSNAQSLNEELKSLDRGITDVQLKLKECQEKLVVDGVKCKELATTLTMEEAEKKRDDLEAIVSEMRTRLDALKSDAKPISEAEKKKIIAGHEMISKEYRKRKRICMEMVHAILDGYPKSKKELLQDLGIEMDEDVGFTLKV